MGAIISRWKTKPSTVELLESLDKDIKDLEEFRAKNQRLLKLWVGRLLFYSSALYLITCLCVYYLYFPEQWTARLITALPLLAFPALCPRCEKMHLKTIQSLLERVQIHKNAEKPKNLWDLMDFSEEQQAVQLFKDKQGTHEQLSLNKKPSSFRVLLVRKLLIFLFSKRTERNNEKLDDLKTQKRKILEEVMETETYKNAKVILERFDPESKKKVEAEATPVRPHMTPRPGQDLRQRHVAMATPGPVPSPMSPGGATPLRGAPGGPPEKGLAGAVASPTGATQAETPQQMMRRSMSPYSPGPGSGMRPPGPPLARPVLPRERSTVDRVIEYLVGDGPQNRYALICQQCFSHNGMALKEEFEYVAFRCAYCYLMNPARKTRPQAPKLPEFSFERRLRSESPETQSSAATETPEDSDAPEDRIVSARSTCVSNSGTPWSKVHSFKKFSSDDIERTTTAEPQDPTAEDPPAARESEEEEAQSQQSPPPSEDVQQEEAGAQEQQQKEDESN